MPHALEFPRVLRAVVPLVRRQWLAGLRGGIVDELVALAFRHAVAVPAGGWIIGRAGLLPGFAAITGTLNNLPEPAAGLRSIDAVGVHWRTFDVVYLPAGEVRAGYRPPFAFAIGGENKGA